MIAPPSPGLHASVRMSLHVLHCTLIDVALCLGRAADVMMPLSMTRWLTRAACVACVWGVCVGGMYEAAHARAAAHAAGDAHSSLAVAACVPSTCACQPSLSAPLTLRSRIEPFLDCTSGVDDESMICVRHSGQRSHMR
jgi:hypothetical protein